MVEKRRNKRTEMNSPLIIKRVDGFERKELSVDVVDLSKNGIGFSCKDILSEGQVYEADMQIWTKEMIHVVFKIARIEIKESEFVYGATFVGLPKEDAFRIEVYQTVNDSDFEEN